MNQPTFTKRKNQISTNKQPTTTLCVKKLSTLAPSDHSPKKKKDKKLTKRNRRAKEQAVLAHDQSPMQPGLVPVAFKRNSRAINACAAEIGYRTQWQAEMACFSATPPLSSSLLSKSPVGVGQSPSRPLASLADGRWSQKPEDFKNQKTRAQTKITRISRAACATNGVTK